MGILAKSGATRKRRTFPIVKVLVTGASGFICGYLIQELLEHGYEVVGLDNFSKYGRVQKSYDTLPGYQLVEGNAKDVGLMKELLSDCDHFIAAAAMIGGISYFHEFAYDLLAENERIIASSFDAAIWAHRERKLKKIVVLSSSMVFESTPNTQLRKERNGVARRLAQPMVFKNSPPSTSCRALTSNTSFPIPLCDPSTASASVRSGPCLTA